MPKRTHTIAPFSLAPLVCASLLALPLAAFAAPVIAAETLAPEAGQVAPPDYKQMDLPPVGTPTTDPAFGTPLLRVTDAKARGTQMLTHDYSRSTALNDDDTLLLVHELMGDYHLYSADGVHLKQLPGVVGRWAEPRWIPGAPREIAYFEGNRYLRMNVDDLSVEEMARFPEYTRIASGGEQDISEDGDHYAVMGYEGERPVSAFVVSLSTGEASAFVDLRPAGSRRPNWVGVTPDNQLFIAWNPPDGHGRYHGGEVYDVDGTFLRQLSAFTGHGDLCRDPNGDAVYIHSNAADREPYNNQHWLLSYRLKDSQVTPLMRLEWHQVPHVSCRTSGAAQWATVSTYTPSDIGGSKFAPFDNEVFQLALDGSQRVRRLAHTRSTPLNPYFYQPRVSESRSGRYAVFSSNWGRKVTGSEHYADVYRIELPVDPERRAPGSAGGGALFQGGGKAGCTSVGAASLALLPLGLLLWRRRSTRR